jgi:prophage regulatory protein
MELDRILRLPKVVEVTGLSVATLYRRIDEKTFPRPVRLGKNSVGWRQSAVQAWLGNLEEVGEEPEP